MVGQFMDMGSRYQLVEKIMSLLTVVRAHVPVTKQHNIPGS